MSVTVDTSVRVYDDFNRLLFLHSHREVSALTNELPQGSDQFGFVRATCLSNLEGSVGLILTKVSDMRISIPLDLSFDQSISDRLFSPLIRVGQGAHRDSSVI
jgi:hypothetical protein